MPVSSELSRRFTLGRKRSAGAHHTSGTPVSMFDTPSPVSRRRSSEARSGTYNNHPFGALRAAASNLRTRASSSVSAQESDPSLAEQVVGLASRSGPLFSARHLRATSSQAQNTPSPYTLTGTSRTPGTNRSYYANAYLGILQRWQWIPSALTPASMADEREAFQRQRQWEIEQLSWDQGRRTHAEPFLFSDARPQDPLRQHRRSNDTLLRGVEIVGDTSLGVLFFTLIMLAISLILLRLGFVVSVLVGYASLSLLLIVAQASMAGFRLYTRSRNFGNDTTGVRVGGERVSGLQQLLFDFGARTELQRLLEDSEAQAFVIPGAAENMTGNASPSTRAAAARREEQRLLGASLCEVLPTYEYQAQTEEAVSPAGESSERGSRTPRRLCCPVCLEAVQDGTNVRILPCMHQFCAECIDPWLAQSSTCPVCKEPIVISMDGITA